MDLVVLLLIVLLLAGLAGGLAVHWGLFVVVLIALVLLAATRTGRRL